MAPFLSGPPQLSTPPPSSTPSAATTTPSGDPFVDLMVANFNTPSPPQPLMGFTENGSATFLTTGNPCLDLFFQVVPGTPAESLTELLDLAWAHNPLTTLKLICNLRGVRGTGKSDKNGFYTTAFWLHKHHPKTLACNLPGFADFGYFKDFPEILFRILGLTHIRKIKKIKSDPLDGGHRGPRRQKFKNSAAKRKKKAAAAERNRADAAVRQQKEQQVAGELRHQKKAELANTALERYNRDPDYRFLHDRVSDLFSDHLRTDLESYNDGNLNKISLAAKWCPSLDSSFDKATLLCEAIARKVFPREKLVEYSGLEEAHYAYRVRDRLRKDVLVPLRRALELPEVFMAANNWNELPYNRVASVAMKSYKEHFLKHDEERFKEYLEQVKSGKAKIAAGALLPHEIISSLKDGDGGEVAELQWKRMVEDLSKEGKLNNCISVCDVSGSMSGTPMEVCVALGMLLSELAEEPWKGKVITFSANPQLHVIQGDTLKSKMEFVQAMDWGMNTNFQKVFDLILSVAVKGKLPVEKMVKRVFVFSDMEFDEASSHPWETDYMVIKRKYEENGYGNAVPEIVFWNLRDSRSIPVAKNQEGVALVSGFSKNMLKLFLDGKEDQLSPETVMEAAISGEEYNKLVVLD
ncbi:hypothetical protein SOVF_096720 [Spinacia oleracea]|uniref:Plant/T31B5-30 protein n=1 Tax=Spinacia oleracea TaxID=3562 RepID=A0A9R0JPF5_SPIOL|nr:uncharacterized protein LOC110782021 [Spinacia oleracea]KNA15610.1 hypothetical protein SOVF_096720 [Spinacia oleracea]